MTAIQVIRSIDTTTEQGQAELDAFLSTLKAETIQEERAARFWIFSNLWLAARDGVRGRAGKTCSADGPRGE